MTMTDIELIIRCVTGIVAIIIMISISVLLHRETQKTTKILKEKLAEPDDEEEDELPPGEWVKIEDVQNVLPPILKRFYGATDGDIECIIQEIEQKAYLIK